MRPDGDMQVSKIGGIPHQKIAVPEGGAGNSTGYEPKLEIHGGCHFFPSGGK